MLDTDTKKKTVAAVIASPDQLRSDGIVYKPSLDFIRIICESTPKASLMRKLIAQQYIAAATGDWIQKHESNNVLRKFRKELLTNVLNQRARLPYLFNAQFISQFMKQNETQNS